MVSRGSSGSSLGRRVFVTAAGPGATLEDWLVRPVGGSHAGA